MHNDSSGKLNIGLVGFGKMGRIRKRAIYQDGRGIVQAVYDPTVPDPADDVPFVNTEEAILSDPAIDAVFICTPSYRNKPLTIAALRRGKHVFCEKPPAFNAGEVREIQAVERETCRRLMYGFNHRHHTSIHHMKSLINSGEYGRLLWMRGRYGKSVDEHFFDTWRAKRDLAGGGILLDQGIHMLDLFLYLAGRFDEVYAFVSNLYWKLDIEDNVFAIFRNSETGLVASLHSTMTQWRHLFSLEIFLERGYLVLNGLKTSSGTYGDEALSIAKNRTTAPAATWEDEERITYHTDHSWRSEVSHFFDSILQNQPIRLGTSEDALELMTLIDRIYACA